MKKLLIGEQSIIYEAVDTQNNTCVIKVFVNEDTSQFNTDSLFEAEIIQKMSQYEGFCKLFDCNVDEGVTYIVQNMLGLSLENLKQICQGKFSLKTTLQLGIQILDRIETLHSKGLTHGQIHPNHFLIGSGNKTDTIYMVSLGNCCVQDTKFKNEQKKYSVDQNFSSVNLQIKNTQQWSDDIESLGYMMVYFLKGKLPWSDMYSEIQEKKNSEEQLEQIQKQILRQKKSIPLEHLCKDLPSEIKNLLVYSRECNESEKVNFQELKNSLKKLYQKNFKKIDNVFDWDLVNNNILKSINQFEQNSSNLSSIKME